MNLSAGVVMLRNKLTRKFPMMSVESMMVMQSISPLALMQSYSASIHSPHRMRNTIMKEWKKLLKFHRGTGSPLKINITH